MKRVKTAQIGINLHSHAKQIFRSITSQSDVFDVVGYVLVEDEREKFSNILCKYDGYPELTLEEVLNDPEIEAVTIETEEKHLTKYALMAAEHGKHVHMEKPGGCSLAEFELLIAKMKENGKVFHTGYMYRYNPYVIDLIKKARSGELGDIISVDAQMSCKHGDDVRRWLSEYEGGMMFFLGCHLVDLVINFAGLPKEVIPLNMSSGWGGVTADDMGMAIFKYDNANAFIKSSATEHCGFMRRQLVITGEKGTIEINPLEMYVRDTPFDNHSTRMRVSTRSHGVDIASWRAIGEWKEFEPFDRHDGMMTSFAEMVRGEKVNPYTPDYELEVYKHVLKACGSSEIK